MAIEIVISSIFLIISLICLGGSFYFWKNSKKIPKKSKTTLPENFFILQHVIDYSRINYTKNLETISKKFGILQSDGSISPPNNSVPDFVEAKRKAQTTWAMEIIRGLSPEIRRDFLTYFSQHGFVKYILSELDKEI